MACDVCDGILKDHIIYENNELIISLAANTSTSGHLQIFPKEHLTIMDQVPSNILKSMAIAANKMSMILFEVLKVHGTNIIIQNGVPAGQTINHFSVHVIPRRTDDGLKLDWDMKQATNDSLDSMQRMISEGITLEDSTTQNKTTSPAEVVASQEIRQDDSNAAEEKNSEKKNNYWLKSLERIP